MDSRSFTFIGGGTGKWRILSVNTVTGEPIPDASKLEITAGFAPEIAEGAKWAFRGIVSNERYVTQEEKKELAARQPGLGRPEATCAALIPIRKKPEWWSLTQDQRRKIFEESSDHIKIGLRYLPAIARRLHHCRDLSENEPFDFLTWFEYSPAHSGDFEKLLTELRASREWSYVSREIDIRLSRE